MKIIVLLLSVLLTLSCSKKETCELDINAKKIGFTSKIPVGLGNKKFVPILNSQIVLSEGIKYGIFKDNFIIPVSSTLGFIKNDVYEEIEEIVSTENYLLRNANDEVWLAKEKKLFNITQGVYKELYEFDDRITDFYVADNNALVVIVIGETGYYFENIESAPMRFDLRDAASSSISSTFSECGISTKDNVIVISETFGIELSVWDIASLGTSNKVFQKLIIEEFNDHSKIDTKYINDRLFVVSNGPLENDRRDVFVSEVDIKGQKILQQVKLYSEDFSGVLSFSDAIFTEYGITVINTNEQILAFLDFQNFTPTIINNFICFSESSTFLINEEQCLEAHNQNDDLEEMLMITHCF